VTDSHVFLVEGEADKRFLENIIVPKLENGGTVLAYSQEPDSAVETLIQAFDSMYREQYLLRDFDKGQNGCTEISDRIAWTQNKFSNISDEDVVIVADAIEGWYLAGLSDEYGDEMGIEIPETTMHVDKTAFNQKLQDSVYSSQINFQKEIIERFSVEEGKRRNSTFEYMIDFLDI
jgi:hypothetical protein